MTHRRRSRIAVVIGIVAMTMALPSATRAEPLLSNDVPIQPGAPVIDKSPVHVPQVGTVPRRGTYCALNFVLKDKVNKDPSTYIGTAGNCMTHVGQRARSPKIGSFGTVVFHEWPLALIRIDTDKLKYVSRVVRGYGAAPTGYTTSKTARAGDIVLSHGYPAASTDPNGITRTGVLLLSTGESYTSAMPPILDRGSPVIRVLDGKAVGMSTELNWPGSHSTVEGLLALLKNAGFNVTL